MKWKKVCSCIILNSSVHNSYIHTDVSDPSLRDNAILFQGSPISHLPTSNIFAYATHFDTHPIAMEWIDDLTCILVFTTKSAARVAFRYLAKSHAEEPSDEGFITSKPIPVDIWPAKERIDKSLGVGEGLKGPIRMRWALTSDVKKRGAKNESQFYRKYGTNAGKEGTGNEDTHLQKRRRGDEGEISDVVRKAQLDEEMDAFLAEDDAELTAPSPPSKMRADYVNSQGKSLLERTSDLRQHPVSLETRLTERWSKHSDHHHGDGRLSERIGGRSAGRRRSREGGSRKERPRATQEELDAELDAFLAKDDTKAT